MSEIVPVHLVEMEGCNEDDYDSVEVADDTYMRNSPDTSHAIGMEQDEVERVGLSDNIITKDDSVWSEELANIEQGERVDLY
jgi:hypothetical protein